MSTPEPVGLTISSYSSRTNTCQIVRFMASFQSYVTPSLELKPILGRSALLGIVRKMPQRCCHRGDG